MLKIAKINGKSEELASSGLIQQFDKEILQLKKFEKAINNFNLSESRF